MDQEYFDKTRNFSTIPAYQDLSHLPGPPAAPNTRTRVED